MTGSLAEAEIDADVDVTPYCNHAASFTDQLRPNTSNTESASTHRHTMSTAKLTL